MLDPVPGIEARWLAGFAPVGETGFIIIVQTRYDPRPWPARPSRRARSLQPSARRTSSRCAARSLPPTPM